MIIPALEYRRFMQRPRTVAERQHKLAKLAERAKTTQSGILASYAKGDDILDPDIFTREDIIAFAKEERIENDPLVQEFIKRSRPLAAWA